jgi:phosphate starvation-inducible PhoH-like protein/PhoH-like ATPase
MKNKSNNNNFDRKEDITQTLDDHMFYGFDLDDGQRHFINTVWDPEKIAIICNAKAGTGKTTLSLGVANLLYQYGLYDRITYIISPTQEQRQGFLPGDQASKTEPYMQPLVDALLTLGINPQTAIISENNIQALKNGSAYIEFKADTYLRGINLENRVVIIDEAQNFYFDDLKKTLTRIHDNCKIIIIGHTEQCDIYKKPERTGFGPYLKAFNSCNDKRLEVCELTINHRGWFSNFCDNVELNI